MLVVILVLAAVVAALGFSLFKVSQQHVHLSSFHADRERAYHLAVGGMKIGQDYIQKAFLFFNKSSNNFFNLFWRLALSSRTNLQKFFRDLREI